MARISTDDQAAFIDSLSRLLGEKSAEADVRRAMETPQGYDRALWRSLADIGLVGLIVEPAYGGVGAGPAALERAMEAAGAALLCGPLLSSGVMAAGLIQALDDEDAKGRWLPAIADGSKIATVALTGPGGRWTKEAVDVRADPAADRWMLNGVASFVTSGQIADLILVIAATPDGLGVFEVEAGAAGLAVEPLATFDHTLRLAELSFRSTPARPLHGPRAERDAVDAMLDLARVALAGEQAGAARRVLDLTVDYAKARIQFGRPIGSFQAIKHMAADLLLETESAISAARAAAAALEAGADDKDVAISLAAFACADAFVEVARASIQMCGGIAFTWDHPAHLYLRRARADAQLFGASAAHRDRFLAALGG